MRVEKFECAIVTNIIDRIGEQGKDDAITQRINSRDPELLSCHVVSRLNGLRRCMPEHSSDTLHLLMSCEGARREVSVLISILGRGLRCGAVHQQLILLENQNGTRSDDVRLVVSGLCDLVL